MALTLLVPSLADYQRAALDGGFRPATRPDVRVHHREAAGFGNWPIRFEPNVGQASPQVEYTVAEQSNAIALDSAGNAYIAGSTYSDDFPVVDPLQAQNNAGAHQANNAFISVLDSAGSTLLFSTYLGGSGSPGALSCPVGVNPCVPPYNGDSAVAIAVDGLANLYVSGTSNSSDFPTVAAFDTKPKAIFVTKIDAGQVGGVETVADPPAPDPGAHGGGGALGWNVIGILSVAAALRSRKQYARR
jgi:hypothetical protein